MEREFSSDRLLGQVEAWGRRSGWHLHEAVSRIFLFLFFLVAASMYLYAYGHGHGRGRGCVLAIYHISRESRNPISFTRVLRYPSQEEFRSALL